ncbi:MAG: hypothetical protein LQ350_003337 [Teloschistes chrysophthalmus]|nr:MAG: hypothetical protein LQ350_003337 [Niorma chrysophthalma]
MPHAENGSTMTQPTVNGDQPSQFIKHVTSYPAVSDSIDAIEANPYGKKGLELANGVRAKVVDPVLPYAERPYGYIKPYVQRADTLADSGLGKIDARYPIVKQDTHKIKNSILDFAFMPLRMANEGKDYLIETYGKEYRKCGGDGYVAGGKAVVTTGLVVTSDSLAWLASYLNRKKEEGKDVAKQTKEQVQEKVNN